MNMNFRTKSPAPTGLLVNNQCYPPVSTHAYSSRRVPTNYLEPTSNPYRYSELSSKPTSVTNDYKPKATFSLNTFPSIPTSRDIEHRHNMNVNTEEQKQKFRQVSDSLAQLKKKLQGIIIEKNEQASDRQSTSYTNKSLEKQSVPITGLESDRKPNWHNQQVQKMDIKPKNIQHASGTQTFNPAKRYYTESTHNNDKRLYFNQNNNAFAETHNSSMFVSPEKNTTQDNSLTYRTEPRNVEKLTQPPSTQRKTVHFEQEKNQLQSKIAQMKKQIEILINEKQRVKQLLNTEQSNNAGLQQKYAQVCEQLEQYKKKELLFREKIANLERQLVYSKNKNRNSFDDVLKDQMQETNRIKQSIEEKNEQITRLNETILSNRRTTQQATNNVIIEKLKFTTEKKQMEQLHEIAILNKENQTKTLRHALETMEAKLQVAVRENKTKDQFIQQYIVGRMKAAEEKDHAKSVLSSYVIDFPTNKLKDKLLEEQQEIDRLRKLLQNQSKGTI